MSENKKLGYFVAICLILSAYLCRVAYTWEDHPDVAFIDHFVDFHIDYDRVVQDSYAAKEAEREFKQSQVDFAHDLHRQSDRNCRDCQREGTCGYTPDRDR